jgi:hypothetical protein
LIERIAARELAMADFKLRWAGLRPYPSPDEGLAEVAWSGVGTCKPDSVSLRPNPLMNG